RETRKIMSSRARAWRLIGAPVTTTRCGRYAIPRSLSDLPTTKASRFSIWSRTVETRDEISSCRVGRIRKTVCPPPNTHQDTPALEMSPKVGCAKQMKETSNESQRQGRRRYRRGEWHR